MPKVSTADNPQLAQQMLDKLDREQRKASQSADTPVPTATPPHDSVFTLPGGYLTIDGELLKEIEVRELTGRDEEYLFKFRDNPGRFYSAILECGVVRIGDQRNSHDLVDSMLAGDWEAALIYVRIATFGKMVENHYTCRACGTEFRSEIDLTLLDMHGVELSELQFEVVGRHGTRYVLNHAYGSTQRKLLAKEAGASDMNSILL